MFKEVLEALYSIEKLQAKSITNSFYISENIDTSSKYIQHSDLKFKEDTSSARIKKFTEDNSHKAAIKTNPALGSKNLRRIIAIKQP